MDNNIVINTSFTGLIIILIIFYCYGIITDIKDKIILLLLILVSLTIIFSKNLTLLDASHFLLCVICLPYIAIFSNNKYLLILNMITLALIILSRHYYKKCILNDKQNNEGFCTDLSHNLGLDWYIIFPILLAANTIRYYKLETT